MCHGGPQIHCRSAIDRDSFATCLSQQATGVLTLFYAFMARLDPKSLTDKQILKRDTYQRPAEVPVPLGTLGHYDTSGHVGFCSNLNLGTTLIEKKKTFRFQRLSCFRIADRGPRVSSTRK